jgi:hypothetical protein
VHSLFVRRKTGCNSRRLLTASPSGSHPRFPARPGAIGDPVLTKCSNRDQQRRGGAGDTPRKIVNFGTAWGEVNSLSSRIWEVIQWVGLLQEVERHDNWVSTPCQRFRNSGVCHMRKEFLWRDSDLVLGGDAISPLLWSPFCDRIVPHRGVLATSSPGALLP